MITPSRYDAALIDQAPPMGAPGSVALMVYVRSLMVKRPEVMFCPREPLPLDQRTPMGALGIGPLMVHARPSISLRPCDSVRSGDTAVSAGRRTINRHLPI
jgi:hypothetical protein